MLIRIVKMTFDESKIECFLKNFKKNKHRIRNFEGCCHLKLLRDKYNTSIFFSYSKWESEEHLMNYRNSDFFKSVWSKTKILFSDKPEAWSVDLFDEIE